MCVRRHKKATEAEVTMHRPRSGDQGGTIPHISEHDPLPGYEPPTGRWGEPYMAGDGEWKVFTRHPLTVAAVQYGLKSQILASSVDELRAKMEEEDRKWLAYVATTQSAKNTG